MKDEAIIGARDSRDRLVCQVHECKARIAGKTGLDELEKLQRHMERAHLVKLGPGEVLELRAKWERSS